MNKNNNQSWQSWSKTSIVLLTFLFWVTVFISLSSNASAQGITNGDFETGDWTGWEWITGRSGTMMTPPNSSWGMGNYCVRSSEWFQLYQSGINFSGINAIEFDYYSNTAGTVNFGYRVAYSTAAHHIIYQGTYTDRGVLSHAVIDVSGFSGVANFYYWGGANVQGGYTYVDNLELIEEPPASFINFTPNVNITDIKPVLCEYNIHPDDLNYYYDNDTKRVGNTVEIMNGWTSYTCPELPTLWISEGFTDSNVSGSHTLEYCDSYNATYDIELRASWYELEGGSWLWHHGRDGLLLASDTILWTFNYTYPDPEPNPDPDPYDPPDPYEPPEIPPPPMPNYWNMTIPEKYQNVTWLTNYTTYFNEMGGTINTTLYSVSGWVISPLMSLNNTVYSLRYYMASTHNMVNGLSHLHMIVNYGWAVVPTEIKIIFTGSAAIGVCIFLFKRRT